MSMILLFDTVSRGLLDGGLPLRRVRGQLEALRTTLPRVQAPLHELRIRCENDRVVVDEVALPLRGVTPELSRLRIAHITDLHIGPLLEPERLRGFVRRINDLRADLIVITGDIFDFDPSYVEAGCRELGRLETRK